MPKPDLGGVDAMPMRNLARLQQEIDRRRGRPALARYPGVAKTLTIPAAFRVRRKIKLADHVLGGTARHVSPRAIAPCRVGLLEVRGWATAGAPQKRFLRSRNSANTALGSAPVMPTAFCTLGSPARRKGLV